MMTILAEYPFTLAQGGEYVVVATGVLGQTDNTPFNLAAASNNIWCIRLMMLLV